MLEERCVQSFMGGGGRGGPETGSAFKGRNGGKIHRSWDVWVGLWRVESEAIRKGY